MDEIDNNNEMEKQVVRAQKPTPRTAIKPSKRILRRVSAANLRRKINAALKVDLHKADFVGKPSLREATHPLSEKSAVCVTLYSLYIHYISILYSFYIHNNNVP